jgi:HlyD family secretion protein
MSATADIQTERKSGVYSIPIQAVTTRTDTTGIAKPEGSKKQTTEAISSDGTVSSTSETVPAENTNDEPVIVVFVVSEGKATLKPVKTGIQDNNYIEVDEGLEPEDEVVIAPYSAISRQLKNDMNVEVVPEDKLFSGNDKD